MAVMKRILSALLISLAAACGGSSEPAPAQPTPQPEATAAHEDHSELPPAAAAFHDRLSPLWHADAGAKRTDDTCAATDDLLAEAGPMHDGSPVAEDKLQAYSEAVGALKTAIVELGDACKEEGRPNFDAAFTKVHEAFHAVIEFFGHQEPEGGHHGAPEGGHAH